MVFYSYKADGTSPIQGGCTMLFNNNIMELYSNDDGEYVRIMTEVDENGIVTLTADQNKMSYIRILVINMPIQIRVELPF